jgi:hypothetical protein
MMQGGAPVSTLVSRDPASLVVHVDWGSFGSDHEGLFARDRRAMKAALLYADRVEFQALTWVLWGPWDMVEFHRASQSWFLRQLKAMLKGEPPPDIDPPTDRADEAALALSELAKALLSGHVTPPLLSKEHGEALLEKAEAGSSVSMGDILIGLIESWEQRLSDPSVVPLVGGPDSFVRMPGSSAGATLEGSIATGLLGELEAFPDASIDVILDVRERLAASRSYFRAAVIEFARELAAAEQDHEPSQALIRDLRVRKIDPAVQAIREDLEALGARRTLARVASDVRTVAATTGWLSMGTASATGLAGIGAFLAAAPMAPAVAAVAKEIQVRQEVKADLQQRPFWTLVEAEDLLRSRGRRR